MRLVEEGLDRLAFGFAWGRDGRSDWYLQSLHGSLKLVPPLPPAQLLLPFHNINLAPPPAGSATRAAAATGPRVAILRITPWQQRRRALLASSGIHVATSVGYASSAQAAAARACAQAIANGSGWLVAAGYKGATTSGVQLNGQPVLPSSPPPSPPPRPMPPKPNPARPNPPPPIRRCGAAR